MVKEIGDEVVITYGFPVEENVRKLDGKRDVWRIIYCVCASLSSIPYGIMLGWPSPINPIMLGKQNGFQDEERNSSISIDWDFSAMIAGFLMLGNVVGTCFPFSQYMTVKTGLVLGNFTMVIGWAIMWQSNSVPLLLASRLLTGTGYSFLLEHLKTYIKWSLDPGVSTIFIKLLNSFAYFGVVLMFSYGSYIEMNSTSLVSLILSLFVLSVVLVLPGTNHKVPSDPGLLRTLSKKELRSGLSRLLVLATFQQFSGMPATIIYTQTVFKNSQCPTPKESSILYASLYLITNTFTVFVLPKYNKRMVLVFSSLITSLTIVMYVTSMVIGVSDLWGYASTMVMFGYMISHSLGLGNVPVSFVQGFPDEVKVPIGKVFFIVTSLGGLLVTKIFQVLMNKFGIGIPFCLFLGVSLAAFMYAYFCLEEEDKS